ncbi:MAG: DUF222 domain-containing protein, partial [Acidimicrobiia bacterium]|nr:DUF222 domain-containing protein [Acidimicrobiia bacterium]
MFDIQIADIGLAGETEAIEPKPIEPKPIEPKPQETSAVEADPWAPTRLAHDGLPRDLESIPPGPYLFAILNSVDRAKLSGSDVLRLLQARERLSNHLEAEVMADIEEVAHCVDSDHDRLYEAHEFAAPEVAAALHLTRRSAEQRVEDAVNLRVRLPRAWEMLRKGQIDVARAKVMLRSTEHLSLSLAREIVDRVAVDAPGLTTGQLRARIQRLSLEADAEAARKAYQRRVEDRRCETGMNPEGTANLLILDAPPDQVAEASANVDAMARSLKGIEGETRTLDQLRTDVALDLLAGRGKGKSRSRAVLEIRVEATTLADLDQRAGEIPGMGPVIADIARQFASKHPNGEWRYAVIDNGTVADSGITRRRPTFTQRR